MGAAIYAARAKLKTVLVAKELGGYLSQTDRVENYLGFISPSGLDLKNSFEEHIRSYDIEILEDEFVKSVYEKNDFVVCELSDGSILNAKRVVIATGSKRKTLGVPGEVEFSNKGVTYCAVCDGSLFQDQVVAIIGGSYSGTKSALYLSNIARKVYIIELNKLKGEALLLEQIKNTENIEVIEDARTLEIYGSDFVEGLKYEKDSKVNELVVDGISIEIGLIPSSDLATVDKDDYGKIVVDEDMRSSCSKIFAVGDVNNSGPEQIIVAAAQGCIAALKISEDLK